MKKNIKLLSLCFIVAAGFSSCEPAEDDIREEPRDLGGYAYLSDQLISPLDENEDLLIDLFTAEGVEVESVEILQGGEVIGTATVSGETASFSASIFGDLEAGTSESVRLRTTLSNGNIAEDPFTIDVIDGITIDEAPETVKFMDSTTAIVAYSTFADYAAIDKVSLFFKKNSDGEYSLVADDLDVDSGEINLGDFDYEANNIMAGDTIYYRFVAESGEIVEDAVAVIPVVAQDFGATVQASLSDDPATDSYDLGTGTYVDNAEAEMVFINPFGFMTQQGIDFVQATVPADMTAEEFITSLDLMEAEELYMEGETMDSVEDVESDDVFIYKVVRTNADGEEILYYGFIKIGDTTLTNDTVETFEFEYAEGTILRD